MERSDFKRCFATVDFGLMRENLRQFRELSPGRKMLVSVKANAYGHGISETAAALEDMVDMYAVATVDEGAKLREETCIKKPILIFGPCLPELDERIIALGLDQPVFDPERVRALSETAAAFFHAGPDDVYKYSDGSAHVHIAVDTGMSRIGLTPDLAGAQKVAEIVKTEHVTVDGIFTHFAKADAADLSEAEKAYASFLRFKSLLGSMGIEIPLWHAANTAGIIAGIGTDDEMDMVRLGIGLYGMFPSKDVDTSRLSLRPPMQWYAYVTQVKEIEAGTSVGYGYTFTADRRMRVGTVSAGYADGFTRQRSNKGYVLIGGHRCRIIGIICMDLFMVDLSDAPEVREGALVTLMGTDGEHTLSAEEIADDIGTISYEIVSNINLRVPRAYI